MVAIPCGVVTGACQGHSHQDANHKAWPGLPHRQCSIDNLCVTDMCNKQIQAVMCLPNSLDCLLHRLCVEECLLKTVWN